MNYLLGIDNGGTFIKAVIFDENGNEICKASGQTPMLTPKPYFTERDMENLWLVNAETIKKVITNSKINPTEIKGVSFSGHGKGLYLWGKDEKPSYNGIMSTDARASIYPKKWHDDGTASKVFNITFQKILACQPVSLLAWLRDNEPKVLENTKYIFGVKDFIRFKLTSEAFAEITDFSGSNLLNLKTKSYDDELLKLFNLESIKDKLPPLKNSTDLCGYISEEASKQTGLLKGTPCSAGMFDIDSCAIAMNITDSENIAVIAGTWSINEYIKKEPVLDGSVMMNSIYCIPEFYLLEECSPTSASNLEWYINMFLKDTPLNGKSIYEITNDMVNKISPKDQDIIFLPYIFGSNYNSNAKASFIGIDSHHTDGHIIRAVYEGIAFCHKVHLEKLLKNRTHTNAIRLAGGVTNSEVWVQIFADVFGIKIETIKTKELGAFGASMAAGVVAGFYENLESAAKKMVKVEKTFFPNPENVLIYKEKYTRYLKASNGLEFLWN